LIKFNRIGNKLGLAGVFGILLSGGMVANQMVSESAIKSANLRAEGQQIIADIRWKPTMPCGGCK
jgi:hypothetical protein